MSTQLSNTFCILLTQAGHRNSEDACVGTWNEVEGPQEIMIQLTQSIMSKLLNLYICICICIGGKKLVFPNFFPFTELYYTLDFC